MSITPLFPADWPTRAIDTAPGVRIHVRTSGGDAKAPPLLLLHGHPQTHAIWHKVADELARHFSGSCCPICAAT